MGSAAFAATAAAVVGFSNVGDDPAESVPPAVEVINAAVMERDAGANPGLRRPAQLIIQDEIDAAVARRVAADLERSSTQTMQDEIEVAPSGPETDTAADPVRHAYLIIRDSIDAALEERSIGRAGTSSG